MKRRQNGSHSDPTPRAYPTDGRWVHLLARIFLRAGRPSRARPTALWGRQCWRVGRAAGPHLPDLTASSPETPRPHNDTPDAPETLRGPGSFRPPRYGDVAVPCAPRVAEGAGRGAGRSVDSGNLSPCCPTHTAEATRPCLASAPLLSSEQTQVPPAPVLVPGTDFRSQV